MEEKSKFAKFIADKRKEANLTQKELAERLYVTDTTISKWERGLSYPDITLISTICKELKISEHEFFIACEDVGAREEKRQAVIYRNLKKISFWTLNISYMIGILTSFICNLAIDHTLSWFFIVLAGVTLAASITVLPVVLKQSRTIAVFAAATIMIYVLELICDWYSGGDWFISIAVPITTFSIVCCWLMMLVIRYTRLNIWLKTGISAVIMAIVTVCTNPFVDYLLKEKQYKLMDYITLDNWSPDVISNKIIFYVLIVFAVFCFVRVINTKKES